MKINSVISSVLLAGLTLALLICCKKDGTKTTPTPNPTVTIAAITIAAATNITATTATSGGEVTSDGGATVTSRGVCWSAIQNPTTSDSKTSNSTGTGSFTSSLTGLSPGATYYLKAYAINSVGTAYSSQATLTTLALVPVLTTTVASAITSSTATSGGNITNDGGSAVTARGVCWSTSANPTTANTKTTDASGTGTFTSAITGLTPGTNYYIRAYATNSIGTAYGNEVTLTASAALPTLTTGTLSAITSNSVACGGNITNDGGSAVTARGVCWSTSQTPTIANTKSVDGTGTGIFTSSITGLLPGTFYYIRAYATNNSGTAYGNEVSIFTTTVIPVLTTTEVSAITATSLSSGGNITSDGGAAVTQRGICYSINQNPNIVDNGKISSGTGIGSFTSTLTGLAAGTTYYIRAYATNSMGTAYGNQVTGITTTQVGLAAITTNAVTAISSNTATSGGNITSGGATVTAQGVCWSTSQTPITSNSKTTDSPGILNFTSSLTGLTANTTYYVRAYATNSAGTAYGTQVSFTTTAAGSVPSLTTTSMTAIASTTATSGGNITSDGGASVTARGVCWATTSTPTTANSKTTDGTGTGSFTSSLTSLSANTTYYVRAYATNSAGTAYGTQVSFTTLQVSGSTVTDIDGNVYNTVTIGTQVWIKENLKTTKFKDGTAIPLVKDNIAWSNLATSGYCWHNNDSIANKNVYGALYNWYSVATGKLCPTGWHVPSAAEWISLANVLGSLAGGKLKETGTSHWQSPNTGATNETGFTALPGSYRATLGGFGTIGTTGFFWSSTEDTFSRPWIRTLSYSTDYLAPNNLYYFQNGSSVRCLKD
ncbi:MAG: hypothetical protein NTZ69_00845 [Bacteroidia bacterium]|nr:hypothetical protein [Bacteroidia bacterium]